MIPGVPSRNRSNAQWIRRHVTDPYVKRSVADGYRSRAAYKLIEIDDKDRLLHPGMLVVDLGAAPGSWSQVVAQRLAGRDRKMRGRIIALDLLPIEPLAGVELIRGDFHDEAVERQISDLLTSARPDLVLSDMSPNLSGIAASDSARSLHLAEIAADFARKYLQPDGAFLVKAFQGSGYSQYVQQLKTIFRTVATRKPAASRDGSAEVYLLARGVR